MKCINCDEKAIVSNLCGTCCIKFAQRHIKEQEQYEKYEKFLKSKLMNIKVIFLDIDGVLNNKKWLGAAHFNRTEDYNLKQLEPRAIHLLNELVAATGAKVVVSSSWRILHSKDELEKFLKAKGFAHSLMDYTPNSKTHNGCRGDEIQEWLSEHPEVSSFVILDDNSDMGDVIDKLVQTSFKRGLQKEHVERAIKLLEG